MERVEKFKPVFQVRPLGFIVVESIIWTRNHDFAAVFDGKALPVTGRLLLKSM
jgi:hypothetical protein